MLTHRGFSAWIVANGKPLPEYLVAVDATNHRVSCWIPSEDGQAFAVYWQDHNGKIDTCSFITLDGLTVPGRFLHGDGIAYRSGVRTSKTTERPFVFQQVTEEEASKSSSGVSSRDAGMVTLRIKRVNRVSTRPPDPHLSLSTSKQGVLRSGDHRVGFGDEVPSFEQLGFTWMVRPFQSGSTAKTPSTYVSFIFRYRSREFLRTQGIMPENEPSPVSTPRPLASSSSHAGAPNRRIASAPVISQGFATSPPPFITPAPSPTISSGPASPASSSTGRSSSSRSSSKASLYNSGNRMPTADTRRAVSMRPGPYTPTGLPGQGMIGRSKTPLQPQNQGTANNRPDVNND
ncbi:uncharacterized protein EV420DRAFT_1763499 [Desarmillaria tabescens]|uniref:DUF7918 domain-containing protein n=1 Tax=Armillaria tabescens TaxID=1929756 RepID=A0AA39N6M9_ARMTA|nr:uncharacterized protein EV420DRAFT_1763499 [Desarmillaria tabescens]KAK0459842.1 hypothetical protein EV420DRAFT_1763499 [Desarmillaria tabescens]